MRFVILLPILMVAACGSAEHVKLVDRKPDPSLLQRCETPPIPSATPTRAEVDKDWMKATAVGLDCAAKFDALADFVEAGPK